MNKILPLELVRLIEEYNSFKIPLYPCRKIIETLKDDAFTKYVEDCVITYKDPAIRAFLNNKKVISLPILANIIIKRNLGLKPSTYGIIWTNLLIYNMNDLADKVIMRYPYLNIDEIADRSGEFEDLIIANINLISFDKISCLLRNTLHGTIFDAIISYLENLSLDTDIIGPHVFGYHYIDYMKMIGFSNGCDIENHDIIPQLLFYVKSQDFHMADICREYVMNMDDILPIDIQHTDHLLRFSNFNKRPKIMEYINMYPSVFG